jgi:hypothetical protein
VSPLYGHSRKKGLLLKHWRAVDNIFINILNTIVSHTAQ